MDGERRNKKNPFFEGDWLPSKSFSFISVETEGITIIRAGSLDLVQHIALYCTRLFVIIMMRSFRTYICLAHSGTLVISRLLKLLSTGVWWVNGISSIPLYIIGETTPHGSLF